MSLKSYHGCFVGSVKSLPAVLLPLVVNHHPDHDADHDPQGPEQPEEELLDAGHGGGRVTGVVHGGGHRLGVGDNIRPLVLTFLQPIRAQIRHSRPMRDLPHFFNLILKCKLV